jgi:hypothetical protein
MNARFVEFCKKVGVVCVAAIAVGTIVGWIWGQAIAAALAPLDSSLAAERVARVAADEKLAEGLVAVADRFERLYDERLDLIDIMISPAGPVRERKLAETRARWRRR